MFKEGKIADEPDQSQKMTDEEWMAIRERVYRVKRLHELIARAKSSKEK